MQNIDVCRPPSVESEILHWCIILRHENGEEYICMSYVLETTAKTGHGRSLGRGSATSDDLPRDARTYFDRWGNWGCILYVLSHLAIVIAATRTSNGGRICTKGRLI